MPHIGHVGLNLILLLLFVLIGLEFVQFSVGNIIISFDILWRHTISYTCKQLCNCTGYRMISGESLWFLFLLLFCKLII